ncbi:MAG TPA: hypothetical protein DCW90_05750 [Lachnospiraceae bacterium]|nr:hypothetical protein [Lachnospiraceae bacterium]
MGGGKRGRKRERKKGDGKGVKKGEGIRWSVMVRTTVAKSSKNGLLIHKLPPLQNGKCCQSVPNNCDYMVNLILSPYILSEYRDIKAIP